MPEEVSISESTLVSNIQNAAENILIKSVEDKPKPYFDIAERELSSPLPPQKYQVCNNTCTVFCCNIMSFHILTWCPVFAYLDLEGVFGARYADN